MSKLRVLNFVLLVSIVIAVFSCTGKKEISRALNDDQELEYYSIFTEATKQAITQNLKRAIELYNVCIHKFPEKAAPYYQVSNIYLNVKEFEKAKFYAIQAAKLDNSNLWYLLHLGNIYQYENNIDSLIPVYEKIVAISDSPEYKYNLAVFYSSGGRVDDSMKLLDELEKEYDGIREIIIMRHRNYAYTNQRDSAVVELEKLIKLFPDEYENYGLLAEYLSEINRFKYAGEIYHDLLEIEPDNGLANISYGDYYLKQGLKDSALVYYKKGFKSKEIGIEDKIGILFNYIYDPNAVVNDSVFIEELLLILKETHEDSRPYSLSAEYYVKRKKFDKALIELEGAIKNGATAYIVWEQYIMIANYLGENAKVKNIYKDALAEFPEKIKLYIYSAYCLYELGEYKESIDVCNKGLEIDETEKSDKVQVMNQMADSYRGLKKYEISDSIYENILNIDPDNLLIRNNYSYYLSVRKKNLMRAEELSRLTIEKEPNNATYLDTYGWILYSMGNYKDALKYLELAIKNGAYTNSEVLEHYGDAALQLDRCREAIEAWNEALKYDSSLNEKLNTKIKSAEENCR